MSPVPGEHGSAKYRLEVSPKFLEQQQLAQPITFQSCDGNQKLSSLSRAGGRTPGSGSSLGRD